MNNQPTNHHPFLLLLDTDNSIERRLTIDFSKYIYYNSPWGRALFSPGGTGTLKGGVPHAAQKRAGAGHSGRRCAGGGGGAVRRCMGGAALRAAFIRRIAWAGLKACALWGNMV